MDKSIKERIQAGYGGGQVAAVTVVAIIGLAVLPVAVGIAVAIRLLDRRRRKGQRRA